MVSFHAAFALLVLVSIFGVALPSIRMFRRRGSDLSTIRGSAMLDAGIRGWHDENLRPFEELLVRWRVSATALTYAQLAVSVVICAAYAEGLILIGGWLVLFAGSLDILDGRIARRTYQGSNRGAFLDSVIDRYVDAIAFVGLAVFYGGSWVTWVVLLALVGGFMVSYTRARAEGLGATCTIGFLQRPERYVILGLGSIFGSLIEHITGWHLFGEPYAAVILVLIALGVLSNATAVQRLVYVMGKLEGPARG